MTVSAHSVRWVAFVREFPKLSFEGAAGPVRQFVEKRLRHFGVAEVNWLAADAMVPRSGAHSENAPTHLLVASAMNPLLDMEAVTAAAERATESGWPSVRMRGAIPGTAPDLIVNLGAAGDRSIDELGGAAHEFHWETQDTYNNQFNLFKYKRLKVFLGLMELLPEMHAYDIPTLCRRLSEEAVHNKILTYFTGAGLVPLTACPACGGTALRPLPARALQPLIGFLSPTRPTYVVCEHCGLGAMTPQVDPRETHLLYDRFDTADHVAGQTADDVLRPTRRLRDALSLVEDLMPGGARILDLGGGLGRYSVYAKRRHPDWRVVHSDLDLRTHNELASYGVETRALNFLQDELGRDDYHLISAFEVIEHVGFSAFLELLQRVRRALCPGGVLLFSTPDLDSPLMRSFDFFNAYVPHHQLIFNGRWLKRFFQDPSHGFSILRQTTASDPMEDWSNYFSYAEWAASGEAARGTASVLKVLLSEPGQHDRLLAAGIGTEIVMALKKVA